MTCDLQAIRLRLQYGAHSSVAGLHLDACSLLNEVDRLIGRIDQHHADAVACTGDLEALESVNAELWAALEDPDV